MIKQNFITILNGLKMIATMGLMIATIAVYSDSDVFYR